MVSGMIFSSKDSIFSASLFDFLIYPSYLIFISTCSFTSFEYGISTKETLCDVGTGAGFPGIVLKIVYPNLKITLVDALQKRVNYLNTIIKDLQLENIQAIHTRGEDLHDKYDVVTARAVANIEKLLKYTMHLVNNTGVFVAMKGNIDNELTPEIENKISKKYQILKIEKFELPIENSQRSLIVIKNKK